MTLAPEHSHELVRAGATETLPAMRISTPVSLPKGRKVKMQPNLCDYLKRLTLAPHSPVPKTHSGRRTEKPARLLTQGFGYKPPRLGRSGMRHMGSVLRLCLK